MTAKVFEAALGISDPWSVASVDFDEAAKVLTVRIDFKPGSRFAVLVTQQMPFAAVARLAGESAHRVMAVCERYVDIALGRADFSEVKALDIDETSRARGHDDVTLAADAVKRRVLFVTEGRDAKTIKELAAHLDAHGCPPGRSNR